MQRKNDKTTNIHTISILAACVCFETQGLKFFLHKSTTIAISTGKGEVAIFQLKEAMVYNILSDHHLNIYSEKAKQHLNQKVSSSE